MSDREEKTDAAKVQQPLREEESEQEARTEEESSAPVRAVLQLHRAVGNQSVLRLIESGQLGVLQRERNGATHRTAGLQGENGSNHGGGLPGPLRSGLEQLSGLDLSGVRVHTNSQKPAQVDAAAYTQGQDIHVAPGQEKHLPHEGWHAVQQMQGRVNPTVQEKGVAINDDAALEREADVMGTKALQMKGAEQRPHSSPSTARARGNSSRSGSPVQRGVLDWLKEKAGDVVDAGKSVVGAVSDAAESAYEWGAGVVGSVSKALSSAWDTATSVLGKAASWAWEGIKSLSSTARKWLSRASSAVWGAIEWFGAMAWQGINLLGAFLWGKLAHMGRMAWSFISNLPLRLWRTVVHLWSGVKGALGWMWRGLKGLAGAAWTAVKGVFSWLGSGIEGALEWLRDGIVRGATWAWDFIKNPSLDKLYEALLGGLSWVWEGIKGFVRWGWRGIVGAAKWAWEGIKGLAGWLWDGFVGGAEWYGRLLLYLFEFLGLGELLQLIWGLIFRMRPLTAAEIAASQQVHPAGLIPYSKVRVDDNSIITWINGGRAVTTMHILHYPKGGLSLDVVVHELTHVGQYEQVGAVYMPEAIHAQTGGGGYGYGNLKTQRAAGKRFSDFNREQQAAICQDYYLALQSGSSVTDLQPFIDDMRRGEF